MSSDASFPSPNHRIPNMRRVSHGRSSSGIPPSGYFSTPPYQRLPPTLDTNPQTPITPLGPRFQELAIESGAWTLAHQLPSGNDRNDNILSQFTSPGLVSTASLGPSSPISMQPQTGHQSAYPDLYSPSNVQPRFDRLSVPSVNLPIKELEVLMQPSLKRRRTTRNGGSVSDYSSNSQVPSPARYLSPNISHPGDNMDMSMQVNHSQQDFQSGFVSNSDVRPSSHITPMLRRQSQSSYTTKHTHMSSPMSALSNFCNVCKKTFDKKNEFNKHIQSHEKRFRCDQIPCPRPPDGGFTTQNDLDRHRRTVHGIILKGDKIYYCPSANCTTVGKSWPRWDNFKQHVVRMHGDEWSGGKVAAIDKALASFFIYDPATHGVIQKDQSPGEGSFGFSTGSTREPVIQLNDQPLEREHAFEQTLTQVQSNMNPGFLSPPTHPMRGRHGPPPKQRHERRVGKRSLDRRPSSPCPPIPQLDSRSPPRTSGFRSSESVINDVPDGAGFMWRSNRTTAAPEEVFDRNQAHQPELTDASRASQFSTVVENELTFAGAHMDTNFNVDAIMNLETDGNDHTMAAIDRTELVRSMQRVMALLSDQNKNPKERERELRTVLHEIAQSSGTNDGLAVAPAPETRPEQPKKFKCTKKLLENDKEIECPKSFDKSSELKKHIRRHDRLYGCTDDKCFKRFGSKWEWKRHENKQHEQRSCWRCDIRVGLENRLCAHVCNNDNDFRNHLHTEHPECKDDHVAISKRCKICYKWQGSHWCGFCEKVISNFAYQVGNERNIQRFDHIYEHLQSKTDPRKIEDWVNLEGRGTTKRESQEPLQQEIDEAEENDDEESQHEDSTSPQGGSRAHNDSTASLQGYEEQQKIDENMTNESHDIRLMNAFGVSGMTTFHGQINDAERPSDAPMYDGADDNYTALMDDDEFNLFGEGDLI